MLVGDLYSVFTAQGWAVQGGVAEWSNAPHLKCGVRGTGPKVRILPPPFMKYLGIDYGTKRVGLATSDDEGSMAFPLRIIPNSRTLVEDIAVICKAERIGTIVVGESHNFENKPNPIMRRITSFAEELRRETGLPVAFMPEIFSSKEAERVTGTNETNDASAAAIVLQSYLDRQNHNAKLKGQKSK